MVIRPGFSKELMSVTLEDVRICPVIFFEDNGIETAIEWFGSRLTKEIWIKSVIDRPAQMLR